MGMESVDFPGSPQINNFPYGMIMPINVEGLSQLVRLNLTPISGAFKTCFGNKQKYIGLLYSTNSGTESQPHHTKIWKGGAGSYSGI